MKTYFVDFFGHCEIEAGNPNEAEEKFWQYVNEEKSLPSNLYTIDEVVEKEDWSQYLYK